MDMLELSRTSCYVLRDRHMELITPEDLIDITLKVCSFLLNFV